MKKGRLSDKIAVVTGSGQGIGKNIAQTLAGEGARVIICGKEREKGRKTVEELKKNGLKGEQIVVDLSKKNAPIWLIRKIVEKYGKIDIVVNNAKAGKRVKIMEETVESWEEGMAVTLRAAFFTSQEAMRQMEKTYGGVIVNIASVEGYMVGYDAPSYHIAKAGLMQMTRYMAVYGGGRGVRVNCIVPGKIIKDEHVKRYEEKGNEKYRGITHFCQPEGNAGRADDVARAVLFFCLPDSRFITGQCLVVDGGLTIQEQSNLVFRYDAWREEKKK